MDLMNYGERAWCRLEVYVFLCLAETSGNHLAAFAYGLSASKLGQRPITKSVAQSGAVQECRRRSLVGPAVGRHGAELLVAVDVDAPAARGEEHLGDIGRYGEMWGDIE